MAESERERLTDLEIRVAYQDRAVAALDEVVRAMHRRIEQLEQQLEELRRAAGPGTPIGPGNEPPPHY